MSRVVQWVLWRAHNSAFGSELYEKQHPHLMYHAPPSHLCPYDVLVE
jgi:hypothetical protein